jgi:hypothetical protein
MGTRWTPVVVMTLVACGSAPPAGHLRFQNRTPVRVVNDRRDLPRPPRERKFWRVLERFDSRFHRRLTRWLEMRPVRRAANVNSIDEVPDSTWFVNRVGARELTVEEISRGPGQVGNPERHLPWTVIGAKEGGTAIGFTIEDARGERFILKFDERDHPETETGADVVVQRLLWAVGYLVPEDHVVYVRRGDLRIVPPLTNAEVDRKLAKVHVDPDGRIRGLTSRMLDGVPLGGHPRDGVRSDDVNDRVPHELRRELRGAYAIFSWLDHTDMYVDNTLDMYVEDRADPSIHYVMHYLVDFGKALGVQRLVNGAHRSGSVPLRGVGLYDTDGFDPADWHAQSPGYFPILDADRFDNFWAAKIAIRLSPAHIRAAVEQGRYSDPRAVAYLTRTIVGRQRAMARHWFDRVAPLDRFAVQRGERLCFEDLAVRYELAPPGTTYQAVAFDAHGRRTGWSARAVAAPARRTCLAPLEPAGDDAADGYTIVRIETRRPGRALPAVLVHLAPPPTGGLRVIGLRRL